MTAWYNEHDPYAAQWLRNLIASGLISPVDVVDSFRYCSRLNSCHPFHSLFPSSPF